MHSPLIENKDAALASITQYTCRDQIIWFPPFSWIGNYRSTQNATFMTWAALSHLHFPDVILSNTWLLSRFKQEYDVCVVYLQIVVHSPHLPPCINEEMSTEIHITVNSCMKGVPFLPTYPWEHPHLCLLARIITYHFVAKLFLRKRRYLKDVLYLQNPSPVNTTG